MHVTKHMEIKDRVTLNMIRDGRFFVLSAISDIGRAIEAAQRNNVALVNSSLVRASHTLYNCKTIGAWNAYDEGLLLITEFRIALQSNTLDALSKTIDEYAIELISLRILATT